MGAGDMAGGIANGIFLLFSIAGLVIAGLIVLSYAAHSYLTVVEQTAAGCDEVRWPAEHYYDWVWKLFYMVWLVGMGWLPSLLVFRAVLRWKNPDLLKQFPGLDALLAAGVAFWLVLPFVFLSSFTAGSRWSVFRLTTVRQMLHKLPTVLGFYVLAGFVVGGALTVMGFFMLRMSWLLLPVFALSSAAALLTHARLLGRLGGQLMGVELKEATPPPKRKRRRSPVEDPWEIPIEERNRQLREGKREIHLPLDGPVDPYLLTDALPPPAPVTPRPKPFDEPGDGYSLAAEAPRPRTTANPLDAGMAVGVSAAACNPDERAPPVTPDELEIQIAATRRLTPNLSLTSGVFTFFWYPLTRDPWLRLSFGFAVMGGLYLFMVAHIPHG
jgi:hypothetical protein